MSSVMFMVGETSGDTLAVELLEAMREAGQEVEPFGAGGPKMKSSGVELEIDLTEHAVIGIWEAVRNYGKFKGFFDQLLQLALDRKPDAVICIDNPGFNLRFVRALRKATAGSDWRPKIIYYIKSIFADNLKTLLTILSQTLSISLERRPISPTTTSVTTP